MSQADTPAPAWQPLAWLDETAFVSVSQGWKAIVSLERGRLMHFGPADGEINLLLAPPTRALPNVWGGHRVWLGPQSAWSKIWPPPVQWEMSGPESHAIKAGVLRLMMANAPDGWPRFTRSYSWAGAKLVCGVEMSGGTRPAQIIQIFQMPIVTVASAQARPSGTFPAGYVRLPSAVGPFAADFAPPPQVTRDNDHLTLRHIGVIEKLGFQPQTLTGRTGDFCLRVSRSGQTGKAVAEPDQGFFTQIYLGGPQEPLIELEQLSPLYDVGGPASFTVMLEGTNC